MLRCNCIMLALVEPLLYCSPDFTVRKASCWVEVMLKILFFDFKLGGEAEWEVGPWEVNKYFIISNPVTLFWLSQRTYQCCTGMHSQRTLLLNWTFLLSFQVRQITAGLSPRSSGMSIASVDRNLSLTFRFIATNIQQNAKKTVAFNLSFSRNWKWKQIMCWNSIMSF